MKRAFYSGRALVVALPKDWANALKILPGTHVCLTLSNQAIHISRALVTSAALEGADTDDARRVPERR